MKKDLISVVDSNEDRIIPKGYKPIKAKKKRVIYLFGIKLFTIQYYWDRYKDEACNTM